MNLYELFSVKDKTVVITGAGSGNGKALAEGFHAAGAVVIAVDYQISVYRLDNIPGRILGDISEESTHQEILSVVSDLKRPGIDVLINNAGVSYSEQFLQYSSEEWDLTHTINLKAPYELCKIIIPSMLSIGGGSIINITSLNAELGFKNNPAYVAMKSGLKGLTKAIAMEFGSVGIRANNLGPGYIHTSMTDNSWNCPERKKTISDNTILNRWGRPEDLIGPAIFLASDASSYITGQDIYVDGGWLAKGL